MSRMPGTQDALVQLAHSFSVDLLPAPSPFQFDLKLRSPGVQRGILTLVQEITKTDIVPSAIDLKFLVKDVRWLNTNITDSVINGGMPVTDLLQLNIAGVTVNPPPATPAGVPGLIAALTGTIPIPVVTTTTSTSPVSVDVRWRVTDEAGTVVTNVSWDFGAAGSGTGGSITPPFGHELDDLNLTFPIDAVFTELTNVSLPPVRKFFVTASVNLTVAGIHSGWIDLPAVPLVLPQIAIPTLALFTKDIPFLDLTLVVVPENSPLTIDTLKPVLDSVKSALQPLSGALAILSAFINGVDVVKQALDQGKVTFVKQTEISNLRDIELNPPDWFDWNGDDAGDMLSSIIFIGPPHRQLQCFNDTDFNPDGQGEFVVDIGPISGEVLAPLLVKVPDLSGTAPPSDPAGHLRVLVLPNGWNARLVRRIREFNDEMSSIRFSWQ